jgi:membrane-associated protein
MVMDFLWDLFHRMYDVEGLVHVGGIVGLTAIVFTETGLLVGFFLPGDSLLVTAGLFAARGDLDVALLVGSLICAAVFGDTVGYNIGARTGPIQFIAPEYYIINRKH